MRLRDISIRAFRLFEDEHVEFVNKRFADKGSADFISIYAPNGFGKTSFFDAIEFCVTKNVRRLKFNNFDENLRSDSKLVESGSFIHNKKMPGENIRVEIGLEGHEGGNFVSEVRPEDERELLKGDGQNLYFSNAFLLQDFFSEFLSVTKSEDRFRLFMQNFSETSDLLDYHSELKRVYGSIGKELGRKKKELQGLRRTITERIDESFVKKIDEVTDSLKGSGIALSWKGNPAEDELARLKMEADQLSYQTGGEIEQTSLALESCKKAENGLDGLMEPAKLGDSRKELAALKQKLAGLKEVMDKILRLKALVEESAELAKGENALKEKIDRLDYLLKNYRVFTESRTKADACDKEIIKLQTALKSSLESLARHQEEKGQLELVLTGLQNQKTKWGNRIASLGTDYVAYLQCQNDVAAELVRQQDLNNTIGAKQKEKEDIAKELEQVLKVQHAVIGRTVTVVMEGYEEDCKQIILIDREIREIEQEIKAIDDNVRKQTDYQSQVKALLLHSREMIDLLKSGVCPLCGHDYQSMERLMRGVESNQAISSAIEVLLKSKTELENNIQKKKERKGVVYLKMEKEINSNVEMRKKAADDIQKELQSLAKELSGSNDKIKELENRIDKDYAPFKGLSIEQVKAAYLKEKESIELKIQETTQKLGGLKAQIGSGTETIKQTEEKIAEQRNAINGIKTAEEYVEYERKLDGQEANEINLNAWRMEMPEHHRRLEEFKTKIKDTQEQSRKLVEEEHVSLVIETATAQEIASHDTLVNSLSAKIFNSIQFYIRECKVKGIEQDTEAGELAMKFAQTKVMLNEKSAQLEKRSKILAEYQNLLAIAEKYNRQKEIEKKIAELSDDISQKESLYNEVEQERKDLETYLEKFVKNYFQLDLINKLYNTIDPHPEYKEIEFKCDFSNKNPRLNIIMGSKNKGEDKIIPNLYFSTAQINILSFCIFMAKAMFATTDKGEDLGCIFIDDPIQALDDINILSMIDLLRNIAFTQKKQIVITTHDQNFFELLQKKMPQDKFNACYLQLYERGKFERV